MSPRQERVVVTGLSGFIAQHVGLELVAAGYRVRGTVRDLERGRALVDELGVGPDAIELVEAHLERDAGWAAAMEGATYVHHVASPFPAVLPEDPDEMIVPARDGTLRVLRAAKAAGVERVVMTSSVTAVAYGAPRDKLNFDESDWSNPDHRADHTAYTLSKTLAERAAWDWLKGEGEGLELTTINPTLVLGPLVSPRGSTSLQAIAQPLGGQLPAIPKLAMQLVDVREVAKAHVVAMTHPEAAGERFLLAGENTTLPAICATLKERFPEGAQKVPTRALPSWLVRVVARFNPVLRQALVDLERPRYASGAKAARVLGVRPRPAEQSILDTARSLRERGQV